MRVSGNLRYPVEAPVGGSNEQGAPAACNPPCIVIPSPVRRPGRLLVQLTAFRRLRL